MPKDRSIVGPLAKSYPAAVMTLPAMGIVIAVCTSAGAFGLMELVLVDLQKSTTPDTVALIFLPEFGTAVLTALLFGALFRTR